MSNSKFASTFAPYTPPPDDRSNTPPRTASTSRTHTRPWFPSHESSQHAIASYQSGGLPTFNNALGSASSVAEDDLGPQNMWETRFGMRVEFMAAFAYLLGPISALVLLIVETHNDYVRFHAYQSALLITPIVCVRIFASLLHFPSFFKTILTIALLSSELLMAFIAYRDATFNGLTRFYVPYIGQLADQWLSEE